MAIKNIYLLKDNIGTIAKYIPFVVLGYLLSYLIFFNTVYAVVVPALFLIAFIFIKPQIGIYVLPFVLGNIMAVAYFIDTDIVNAIFSPLGAITIFTGGCVVARRILLNDKFTPSGLYPFMLVISIILFIAILANHGPDASPQAATVLKGFLVYFLVINLLQNHEAVKRFVLCLIIPYTIVAIALIIVFFIFFRSELLGLRQLEAFKRTSSAVTYSWFLNIVFPLAFSMLLATRSRGKRLLLMGACAFFISAIMLTYTRGGFIILMVTTAAVVALNAIVKKKLKTGIFILTAVFVFFILGHTRAGESLYLQFGELTHNLGKTDRWMIYKWNIETFLKNPLCGVGAGVGPRHSFLFSLLNDNGIFYFIMWFLLFFTCYKNNIWLLRQKMSDADKAVIIGLLASLVGSTVTSIFDPAIYGAVEYAILFWMLRGLETIYINDFRRIDNENIYSG